jgi:hypothetical protein
MNYTVTRPNQQQELYQDINSTQRTLKPKYAKAMARKVLGQDKWVWHCTLGPKVKHSNLGDMMWTWRYTLSSDTTWCELEFPIFRKVLVTIDWWSHVTSRSAFRTTRLEPHNHSTTSPLDINRWCTVDLTKKANPCLWIEEQKQEQERLQPNCRWMINLTKLGSHKPTTTKLL